MKGFRAALLTTFLFVAGCVSYSPVVELSATPRQGMAYLTGLYSDESGSLPDHVSIGITYQNVGTGIRYSFRFDRPDPLLQALEVPPGNYHVSEWFMQSKIKGVLITGFPKGGPFIRQIKVEPDRVYFLGAYAVTGSHRDLGFVMESNAALQTRRVAANAADRAAFAARYPNLGQLPLVAAYD